MAARLSAFVIWSLVAAGAVFWAYRFWAHAPPAPDHAQVVSAGAAPRTDLTRLLGAAPVAAAEEAQPAPAAQSSRFRLIGVLAPRAAASGVAPRPGGVALIAVDGKAPRAYRVGSRVEGDWTLTAVAHRSATLGAGPQEAGFVLELPPLAPPATGNLPHAVPGVEGGRAAAPGGPVAGPAAQPGGPRRSPIQQPGVAAGNVEPDDDGDGGEADEGERPAPPPQTRPRPGATLTQ